MIDKLISRSKVTAMTGLSRSELADLHRKGIITIVRLNARNFKISEADIQDLSSKILAYERQQALAGLDIQSERQKEIAAQLKELYGYVEGPRQ
jgi:hypothetical protein